METQDTRDDHGRRDRQSRMQRGRLTGASRTERQRKLWEQLCERAEEVEVRCGASIVVVMVSQGSTGSFRVQGIASEDLKHALGPDWLNVQVSIPAALVQHQLHEQMQQRQGRMAPTTSTAPGNNVGAKMSPQSVDRVIAG